VSKSPPAKQQREAEQRGKHLISIMQRADTRWSELDPLMNQKNVSAYDQAAAQLQELRDAYAQAGDIGGFEQRFGRFSTAVLQSPGHAAPDQKAVRENRCLPSPTKPQHPTSARRSPR
jgi:hypothetical protein